MDIATDVVTDIAMNIVTDVATDIAMDIAMDIATDRAMDIATYQVKDSVWSFTIPEKWLKPTQAACGECKDSSII